MSSLTRARDNARSSRSSARGAARAAGRLTPAASSIVRKYVKKCVTKVQERKTYLYGTTAIALAAGSGVRVDIPLWNIGQGTGDNQRVGNNIQVTNLWMCFKFYNNAAALVGTDNIRFLLVRDKMANGAVPVISNIVDNAGAVGYFYAPYKNDYATRFEILKDKIIPLPLPNIATAGATQITKIFRLGKRTPGRKGLISYSGTAGTVADMVGNAYYVFLISSEGANYSFNYNTAVWYTDA